MSAASSLIVIADPTRLAIVERLATEGEVSATELARPFGISQPAVSKHIRILEEAGWLSRRAEGTRRYLKLEPARLDEIIVWCGRLRAEYAAQMAGDA